MADPLSPEPGRLRDLDRLASDTRALLRRSARVEEQTQGVGDDAFVGQARLLQEAGERLLELVEQRRQEERAQARRLLRRMPPESDAP
ncbi:MAG: hypothetical protein ACRENY_06450 [Candidatus Dormibacteria bacterium]